MKPFILLPLLGASLAAAAQTPITLTASTFSAAPGTTERYQDAGAGPAPATGPANAWDYRSLAPVGSPYVFCTYQAVPASGGIAGAQWTIPRQSVLGNLGYDYTVYYRLATTGVFGLGSTIARQPKSLGAVTGTPTDSVVINRQTVLYNGTAGVVNFPLPLTTGGYANRSVRISVTGSLTIQALGLNKVPLRIIQRLQYVDSVAGSGTVRIPYTGQGAGSPALPALLVRSRVVRQDSFLLGGSPAPASLLAAFGVTQGQITRYYSDAFWRQGSAQPVLELYYADKTYSRALYSDYSTEPTLLATHASLAALPGLTLYPNPAPAGSPVVLATDATGPQPVTLTLRDLLGRTLATGTGRTGQPIGVLAGLPTGSYLLEIGTADGQLATRRVHVQ